MIGCMALLLRPPQYRDEVTLRRIHEQLRRDDFTFLPMEGTWDEFLERVDREASGIELPPGRVRAEFLVAEVNGVPIGRVSIRHQLNDYLLTFGGHVGYAVAPEHRRRGYATEILRQSIARLRTIGVEQILVTCDKNNSASRAVIETCGGQLERISTTEGRSTCRYWISANSHPVSYTHLTLPTIYSV